MLMLGYNYTLICVIIWLMIVTSTRNKLHECKDLSTSFLTCHSIQWCGVWERLNEEWEMNECIPSPFFLCQLRALKLHSLWLRVTFLKYLFQILPIVSHSTDSKSSPLDCLGHGQHFLCPSLWSQTSLISQSLQETDAWGLGTRGETSSLGPIHPHFRLVETTGFLLWRWCLGSNPGPPRTPCMLGECSSTELHTTQPCCWCVQSKFPG